MTFKLHPKSLFQNYLGCFLGDVSASLRACSCKPCVVDCELRPLRGKKSLRKPLQLVLQKAPNFITKPFIVDLPLCQVFLEDNSYYPWLFLIPRRKNVVKIMDLNPSDQFQLIKDHNDIRIFRSFGTFSLRYILLFALSLLLFSYLSASDSIPKVLAVVAHPDDETSFAATLYKISHEMDGMVDVVMITNGEGGYKYSTLAEPIYHMELTNEDIGRQRLPFIRKNEALNGGKILGVRNYFFLEEKDTGYTQDPNEVLQGAWDVSRIKKMLNKLVHDEHYDFIFVMLPTQETHGHHKAATILALEIVNELDGNKPTILAANVSEKNGDKISFKELKGFPITKMHERPIAFVDKTKKFGFNERLDYKIVVNWVIAEHKSQGTMQLYMNRGDYEDFYFFEINNPEQAEKTIDFFDLLDKSNPRFCPRY